MRPGCRGLVAAIASSCVVVAAAGGAPAARRIDLSSTSQLRVEAPTALDPGKVEVVVGEDEQLVGVAKVTVRVPAGYGLGSTRAVGTTVGAASALSSSADGSLSFGRGPLTIGDPAAAAADPAALACDPSPHLAVLEASLEDDATGATTSFSVFVDGAGTDSTAAYLLEYCPPLLGGDRLSTVELLLDDRVLAMPKAPAVYTWSAFVTPAAPGGSAPDPARTIELRAEVPIPETLALEARYDATTHEAVLSGRYLLVGRPRRGAQIRLHAASKHVSADFGPIRTDAHGRFAYRWTIRERTTFTASVGSPEVEPCRGPSAAPGGCVSTTRSAPADTSAEIAPRTAADPKLATRPADLRLAALIDVRRGDLPTGWQAFPAGAVPAGFCEGFQPKESDLTETGSHASAFLARSSFEFAAVVLSSTTLLATPRQAAVFFVREAKLGRIACFANEARAAGASLVSAGAIPAARFGRRSVQFRIALRQDGDAYYLDEVGVLGRRSVTFLLLTSRGSPPALARSLAAKVARRASGG